MSGAVAFAGIFVYHADTVGLGLGLGLQPCLGSGPEPGLRPELGIRSLQLCCVRNRFLPPPPLNKISFRSVTFLKYRMAPSLGEVAPS